MWLRNKKQELQLNRYTINLIRKKRFKTFFALAFTIPAFWVFFMVLLYEGFGLWIPNQLSVIFAMGFFYVSMVFFYLSISMLYKEDYDNYVTFTSLSILFWYACFIVFPFRYEIDTLKLYTDSIIKGAMISTIFSSIGIGGFLFLYRYRILYEEKRSILLMIFPSVLTFISVVVSIVYFVIYNTRIYLDNLIIIPILYSYILLIVLLVVVALVYVNDKRISVLEYIAFGLLIALAIAMLSIGWVFGDYISHRSFFLGGMFSLFFILSSIKLIYAFNETAKWNKSLFPEEDNPDSAEYFYIKGY